MMKDLYKLQFGSNIKKIQRFYYPPLLSLEAGCYEPLHSIILINHSLYLTISDPGASLSRGQPNLSPTVLEGSFPDLSDWLNSPKAWYFNFLPLA